MLEQKRKLVNCTECSTKREKEKMNARLRNTKDRMTGSTCSIFQNKKKMLRQASIWLRIVDS